MKPFHPAWRWLVAGLLVCAGPRAVAQNDLARWLHTEVGRTPAPTKVRAFLLAEQELEDLERRLVAAIGAKDLVTYDQLVADDYVVVGANGTERTKADVIAGYRAGTQGYRGLEISDVKAHVFGDTGLVHARTLGFRLEGGKETPNRVRYVRVFSRRNGRWQAVAQMAQPLPPDQQ